MDNFHLIENTKSRNMKSDLIMAGGLASSMLFFVMKSQKNKIYFLRPQRKGSEDFSQSNDSHPTDPTSLNLVETRSMLRGKKRLGTLSVKKSEILVNIQEKDSHLKELLKQKPRLSIPQNVFSEHDLRELKDLAQGKAKTWVVEECQVNDNDYASALKKLAKYAQHTDQEQKQIECKEEDIFNRIYWLPKGNFYENQQEMLGTLLASATMNVLLSIEEDGALQGSLKLTLKIKEDLRSQYPDQQLLLFLSVQKVRVLAVNGKDLPLPSTQELSQQMLAIPLDKLRMGLNNISLVYQGQPLQNSGKLFMSRAGVDSVPLLFMSSVQTTLAYLLPGPMYGFNSTKETVDQLIGADFQSRVLEGHKHIVHHTSIIGKRLQIFRTGLPSVRPAVLLLDQAKQLYQKDGIRIYDQADTKTPFCCELQRELTGYLLLLLKNSQETLHLAQLFKIDLVIVDLLLHGSMARKDGVLLISKNGLLKYDRLVWLWKVLSYALSLQMRGQPAETLELDEVRQAVSMYLAYDFILQNKMGILDKHSLYTLQCYLHFKAQQQFIHGTLPIRLLLILIQIKKNGQCPLQKIHQEENLLEYIQQVLIDHGIEWSRVTSKEVLDVPVSIESTLNSQQQYDTYDVVIEERLIQQNIVELVIINEQYEVSFCQPIILSSLRNSQSPLLNKHQQNVLIHPQHTYLRPLLKKTLLLTLISNFSRLKDKSLQVYLLITTVQKYFRRELTCEQALDALVPALENLEDNYYLNKMLGYVNTLLLQSTHKHLDHRKKLVKATTKRLGGSCTSQLVRQINRLIMLPEQYQLLVNLQLEVDVDKMELLPLVLRQYHHTQDIQIKQNYLVCFDQSTQHTLQQVFGSALAQGLHHLLNYLSQPQPISSPNLLGHLLHCFHCLIKDLPNGYSLDDHHLEQVLTHFHIKMLLDPPDLQLLKTKCLVLARRDMLPLAQRLLDCALQPGSRSALLQIVGSVL